MTRFTVSIFAFLCIESAWTQAGAVSGLVTDDRTGLPLPAIEVRADAVNGRGRQQAVNTDAAGRYLFPNIPVGTWSFTAVRPMQLYATRAGRSPDRCIVVVEDSRASECSLSMADPQRLRAKSLTKQASQSKKPGSLWGSGRFRGGHPGDWCLRPHGS